MQEWAKKFYKSKAWRKARQPYIDYRIRIDGGLCEECHELPGYIVHHKIPLTPDNIDDPDIALSFDNFKYDCKTCHDYEDDNHGLNKSLKPLCIFDSNGQPISLRPIDRPPYKKEGF